MVALALAAAAGCTASSQVPRRDAEQRRTDAVRVASFDFAESELLGELIAQAFVRRGLAVERFLSLGSREIVAPALRQGLVDVVPEYLAAALDFAQRGEEDVPAAADDVAERLATALEPQGITVLPHAPAIDRDAIAMTATRARELDVRTIIDLARHGSELDFVGPPECPERSACLPRLEDDYGIEFRSFTGLPPGLPIALALEAGEADVGLMFSSDPLVEDKGLVLLTDDRGFGRAEHVVPLVRDEVLERHGPDVTAALSRITDALTTEELVAMNRRVAHGESPRVVARDWLDALP